MKEARFPGPTFFIILCYYIIEFGGYNMKKCLIIIVALFLILNSIISFPTSKLDNAAAEKMTRNFNELKMGLNVSKACTASYVAENSRDQAGCSVSGVGDINGDGFDDFMIGAHYNDDGGNDAGQAYLIFGRSVGFSKKTDLANADASFVGEGQGHSVGGRVHGVGDVNGDDMDDMMIWGPSYDFASMGYHIFFGKKTGWTMDTKISKSDVFVEGGPGGGAVGDINGDRIDDIMIDKHIFLGKRSKWNSTMNHSDSNGTISHHTSGVGDVNGDGINDILLRTRNGNRRQTMYLFFGGKDIWKHNMNETIANASFTLDLGFTLIQSLTGAGDINGDGYGDIIISAAEKIFFIFGRSSGWKMEMDARSIGASINDGDYLGSSSSCAGAINGDGLDDMIFGSEGNTTGGYQSGQVFLILGKESGWRWNASIMECNASFIGEGQLDWLGHSVSGIGDFNKDGLDDFILSSPNNSDGAYLGGKVYLFMYQGWEDPVAVYSVKVYSNDDYKEEISKAELGDAVHIQLQGLDPNSMKVGRTGVMVSSLLHYPLGFPVILEETGLNTGIYRGTFRLSMETDHDLRTLEVSIGDLVNITSIKDQTKFCNIDIDGPVALRPISDLVHINEDEEYSIEYRNIGYNEVSDWIFETDAVWLNWDPSTHTLSGTPDNGDVGTYNCRINITDGLNHYEERTFEIDVINTDPSISLVEEIRTSEDELFELDLNSDDEGLGDAKWSISPTYIDWFSFDPLSGIFFGIPKGDDVGDYEIEVTIDDGNGGSNRTEFELIVLDKNDAPMITSEPVTEILQSKNYYMQFNALDEDDINTFEWTMITDAIFLDLNNRTGVLTGTPENEDVGLFFVNITAEDLRGGADHLNFTLEVIDVNDPPTWSITPFDSQVSQGEEFSFDAFADDVDIGDVIVYSISSQPDSDITIDTKSGRITWIGSLQGLIPNPNYVLNVVIYATDGKEIINHGFTITVIPNPSPTSTLLSPIVGKRITSMGILLEWGGEDDGEDPLKYDVYLDQSQTQVSMLDQSVLWMEDIEGTSIHTGEVEIGMTYYWTVIPKDNFSSGICTNDVFSFSVNIPPSIQEFSIAEAKIGVEFRLALSGSDLNGDELGFNLEEGPEGMDIFEGMVTWTPTENQVGTHTVNVSLSDGYEIIYEVFEVTVTEKEILSEPDEGGSPIALIIIIIIVILVLAGAGVELFLYMKKRGKEETRENTTNENPPEDTDPPEEGKQEYQQL
jgi:hypothetical protein